MSEVTERIAALERKVRDLEQARYDAPSRRIDYELHRRIDRAEREWVACPLDFYDALGAATAALLGFSAYNDLVAKSKIGTAANQVAAGNHNHAGVYEPTLTDQAWSFSNDSTDRALDVSTLTNDAASVQKLGNIIATLARDLDDRKVPGPAS